MSNALDNARKLVKRVTPLRFMSPAQLTDVLADAVAVDQSSALQACVDYAQANDLTVDLTGLRLRLNSSVTWKQGRSSTDTKTYSVRLRGGGGALYPTGTATAIEIVPRCTLADAGTGRAEAPIYIDDLKIDGVLAAGTAKALKIGLPGYRCSSFEWSKIDTVTVQGFSAGNQCVFITDARHIRFGGVAVRGGSCVITCGTTGGFCGDLVFTACEAAGTEASPPFNITSAIAGASVRGVKFIACAIYGTGTLISSTGSGTQIGDIWFEGGTQFDGPGAPAGERALIINASGGGFVFQVHSDGTYFTNYTGAVVNVTTSGLSTVRMLSIEGGGINLITGNASSGNAALNFLSAESVVVTRVKFDAVTATSLINVDGCENVMIHNNHATNCATTTYGVSLGNGNKQSLLGNVMNVGSAVLNEYTVAAVRQAANNLLV